MAELYELWETAESWDDLPDVPPFEEFELCDDVIDVGYDCFFADAYVWGPYALVYDEEKFGRDTWGWSAQISYRDGNRCCCDMVCHKEHRARDAYEGLLDYLEGR